ncbi:hypothetical protein FSP39_001492 [Pinctada imbricata]|uniref:Uncharacterized protein n=1 Tax=Pinctada imbricata TaxID=66713 RepID=A0AA89BY76_PINIB|nr:hypothetical protein FSP39_001492 [Pinctada imbricata]
MKFQWCRFAVICVIVSASIVLGDKESVIPVSDTGEGTRCDADMNTAQTCLACSRLPQDIAVQLTDCCTEDKAFQFCQVCTKNSDECLKEAYSVEEANIGDDSGPNDFDLGSNDYNKRFGTSFMGSSKFGKRFGRLFFGRSGGSSYIYGKRGKRYRKLGMGSGGFLFKRSDDGDYMDKRYGRLNMGGGSGFFYGKRDQDMNKRFGQGYDGKSSNYFFTDDDKEKRFGKLFMSGKRYGSLFMGR